RRSSTCGGGTTLVSTASSITARRSRSRRRTTLASNQPSQRSLDREAGRNETQGDSLRALTTVAGPDPKDVAFPGGGDAHSDVERLVPYLPVPDLHHDRVDE